MKTDCDGRNGCPAYVIGDYAVFMKKTNNKCQFFYKSNTCWIKVMIKRMIVGSKQ